VPDVTTVSGRRLFFSQLNSEGWSTETQVERYRQPQALAAEVVLRELVEPFGDLPVTLDARDSDIGRIGRSTKQAKAVLERFLSLTQVERPGSVAIGTVQSRFDAAYPSISGLSALKSAGRDAIYYTATGDPDYFNEDLARYRALSVTDISAAAAQFLPLDKRVELIVEQEKKP